MQPQNEIWLKVGDDKGGGSFKFGFQIFNQHAPNAAGHTAVVACLEANDSLRNVHTCLDQYKDTLRESQGMRWR